MNTGTEKKLHVLLMPSWYKTPSSPVDGTCVDDQARGLKAEGHQVGVIFPEYTPPSEIFAGKIQEEFDFYVDNDIPTLHLKNFAGIPKLRRLSYRQFGRAVNKIYLEYVNIFGKPDIIHAHSVFHGGIAGFHVAKVNKVPLVISEHLPDFMMGQIRNTVDLEISREIFNYADAAITVSESFRKDLEQLLKLDDHAFEVIPQLANDLFFETFSPQTWHPGETFRFFTNAFLIPRKNIQLAMDAFKFLIDKNYKVHLTIGGSGILKQTLKEYAAFLGLESYITFTGQLSRERVKEEMDNCHAFLLTSQYESFGIVLIESLACGRPVVITDCSGPSDFIKPEHGLIVTQPSPEEFAHAMEKMIENYSVYDQYAIKNYCMENFGQQKITGEIIKTYHNVLAKRIAYSF